MRSTSIIIFILFACNIAYGLPISPGTYGYESSPKQLVSKVLSKLPFVSKKKSQSFPLASYEPPVAPEAIKAYIERFKETKNIASSLIAMKPGVYEVYSCVPFEQNDVVIKILHGSDIMAEMKNWAQAGYLVAYAAENVRPTTYLILRVATPKGEVPQGERYQNLMQNVRESASKSYALASTRGYEHRQNFVWTRVPGGERSVKLFDWERGYKDRVGQGQPLSEIIHVEL